MNNFKKVSAVALLLSGLAVFGFIASEMQPRHIPGPKAVPAQKAVPVAFQVVQLPEMRILASKSQETPKARKNGRVSAKIASRCFRHTLVQQGSPSAPQVLVCGNVG